MSFKFKIKNKWINKIIYATLLQFILLIETVQFLTLYCFLNLLNFNAIQYIIAKCLSFSKIFYRFYSIHTFLNISNFSVLNL